MAVRNENGQKNYFSQKINRMKPKKHIPDINANSGLTFVKPAVFIGCLASRYCRLTETPHIVIANMIQFTLLHNSLIDESKTRLTAYRAFLRRSYFSFDFVCIVTASYYTSYKTRG